MSFRYPLNSFTLTQGFGGNAAYYKQYGQQGHNGLDLGAPNGTPVYSADDGVVEYEGWGQNHSWMGTPAGICILINHGGSFGGYAHLTSTVVNKGQRVAKGQHIGYVGATGAATGPHLHFEMLPLKPNFSNGYAGRINPTPFIDTRKTATADDVIQAYRDILERDADPGGIKTYTSNGMTRDEVRNDLANSQEKRILEQRKAEIRAAEAARAAQEAHNEAERKKAEDAARLAELEAERIRKEEEDAKKAAEEKANSQSEIEKENNTLLKQILAIVQAILNKITGVFK